MREGAYTAMNRPLWAILVNSSEAEEESYRESPNLLREYLRNPEETVSRNMDCKEHSDEVAYKNEGRIVED